MELDFNEDHLDCLNELINLLEQIGTQIKILTLDIPNRIEIDPQFDYTNPEFDPKVFLTLCPKLLKLIMHGKIFQF